MNVVELHPDELLDKEARGDLSADESARLNEHLAACSVCRFERQTRSDFRSEFEAVGRREKAAPLAPRPRVEVEAPRPSQETRASQETRDVIPMTRSSKRWRFGLLIAAALLVAGAATAGWTDLWRGASEAPPVSTASSPLTVGSPESSAHRGQGGALPQNAATTTATQLMVEPPPSAAASETIVPQPDPPTRATSTAVGSPSPITASPASPTTTAPAPTTSTIAQAEPSAPPPAVTPASMFTDASSARQRGAYDDAIRLYRDLASRYPGSPEAVTAHAILGRLLLDRGDASGALAQFDEYLRSGSSGLREEALAGRAAALQRLGRASEEATAWHTLLDSYPQSMHAARARVRLAALENR